MATGPLAPRLQLPSQTEALRHCPTSSTVSSAFSTPPSSSRTPLPPLRARALSTQFFGRHAGPHFSGHIRGRQLSSHHSDKRERVSTSDPIAADGRPSSPTRNRASPQPWDLLSNTGTLEEGAWRSRSQQGSATSAKHTSRAQPKAGTSGVVWNLACSRDMALVMPGSETQVSEYLQDPENIVHVAFPDSSRLKRLGPELWQARLKPVTFFMVSATPVCTIRAWFDPERSEMGPTRGRLRIASEDLKLEFIGAPEEVTRVKLRLSLDGYLGFLPKGRGTASSESSSVVGGKVDLGVGIEDLPLVLSLIPSAAANQVGSAILAAILDAMKGALTQGLVRSLRSWQIRRLRKVQQSN